MSIKAGIYHLTHYRYDRPVTLGPQLIRLRPAGHSKTRVISHSLKVSPAKHFVNHQQDPYGNWVARYVFPEPVREFKIEVDLVADMTVYNPFDFFVEESAEKWPFDYPKELIDDLSIYRKAEPIGQKLDAFLNTLDKTAPNTVDMLVALNLRLSQEINYIIRMEPGVQTPEETLTLKKGSCRDTSWLLVQILRNLGFAARFVSGYLIQLKPDLKALDGPAGTDKDFTDLHAWAEVYIPGAGWVGMDPTSGLLAGESHIPLAATPHYTNAAPIAGLMSPAEVEFDFDMQISRIAEHPRITKPFSEEAWDNLNALGKEVDKKLQEMDVRLTMGGEPTFVSIDDYESAEWNTQAVGPTKQALAEQLIQKLQGKFAPGGFLHYGQGKWYPGESLPRWTYSLYWRRDGEAIWDKSQAEDKPALETAPTSKEAETLLQAIADGLGVGAKYVVPAYEDPAEWLIKEGNLPDNVTPTNSKLKDPEERSRLTRVFERGLTEPSGYVLPIQAWQTKARPVQWISEMWRFRRKFLYLVPGDSPVGYRMPLSSLPHVSAVNYPYIYEADPSEKELPLERVKPRKVKGKTQRVQHKDVDPETANASQEPMGQAISEIAGIVRTALSVEARDGKLFVFMPPMTHLEHYLDLLATVEETAEELGLPVFVEGYHPPTDNRLNVIRIAPDPGVLEVNIHPATSWDECVEITETLYEEARQTRLGADKFMIDGRHTGTGGGNHVVVGGSTPLDSPFLRRPDLVKSLLLYWQRHPSLSYLFSGLFIGPTSQAPRIDEARHDSLYDLEMALAQIPSPDYGGYVQPWMVDRLLRNILIDVTGNTHRTEICIDKLYSPDGPTGRLGLVEFRGFEMPPNPRMSLAQQLLIRAIIARMWENPITGKPIRWGTGLHDRFMLQHYVWQDFLEVLRDLKDNGYAMDPDWFKAQAEFRFPFCGAVTYEGVELEVRQALEPWNVLGETGAIGGTVRYTDSSVERLQVKLTGADADRYLVTCNQRSIPLQRTNRPGEAVAGVRFKAWQAAESMHPYVPINAPLTFDIFDKWSNRALGGCVYHVAHPGGRNYETFPVNYNEAEARRLARFEPHGHTTGKYMPPTEQPNPDFPYTLDLRRPAGV